MGKEGVDRILARYRVHFIIEHENLVYNPSNNKSIIATHNKKLTLLSPSKILLDWMLVVKFHHYYTTNSFLRRQNFLKQGWF